MVGNEDAVPSPSLLAEELLAELRQRANPENVAGMARFGISSVGTLGVTVADVRSLARDAKRALGRRPGAHHELAGLLWESGVHEARIMATVLEVPALVTLEQAEAWVLDLDSWDTCDQLCGNVLWRVPFAWGLPERWAGRPETYVKRAAFVVAAQLGGKDRSAQDDAFAPLFALIEREAYDDRNDVKKGVNWALRHIGKRNRALNVEAIDVAEKILECALAIKPATPGSRAARWIARDALRELKSDAIQARLK